MTVIVIKKLTEFDYVGQKKWNHNITVTEIFSFTHKNVKTGRLIILVTI